eukprot:scaffold17793_cov131-Isochrysis_galbana.AAC.1
MEKTADATPSYWRTLPDMGPRRRTRTITSHVRPEQMTVTVEGALPVAVAGHKPQSYDGAYRRKFHGRPLRARRAAFCSARAPCGGRACQPSCAHHSLVQLDAQRCELLTAAA